MPVTTPVAALTDALPVLLLVHAPPPGVVFNVVVLPIHTEAVPVIAVGSAFTVSTFTRVQPVVAS